MEAATTDASSSDAPARELLTPVPPSVSKKTLATWKKQLKNLKTKDASKKIDGIRYCAQDERFMREQAEVLPVLMDLLSRVKMPEVVAETLRTFKTLFTQTETTVVRPTSADMPPPSATDPAPSVVTLHPQQNRQFVVDTPSSAVKRTWRAGEPFVALLGATVSPNIKIQAIEVFSVLLDHCTQLALSGGPVEHLIEFQTTGSPATALLTCLDVDHAPLQLAALECICLLFQHPPSVNFFTSFHASDGLTKIQPFVTHPERRFHAGLLKITECFSHHEIGRGYLRASGIADSIRVLLVSTLETSTTTIAAATATPTAPIALTVDEATLLHDNAVIAARSYARMLFANEMSSCLTRAEFNGEYESVPAVLETLITILQRDISSFVSPSSPPVAAPAGNNAAAQAAAAQAAATAATLASLFPFSAAKCIDIISSLGRMVEASDAVQRHVKRNGLLPVLIQAFRVPGSGDLHQSADKLLHLCARQTGPPTYSESLQHPSVDVEPPVDPQLFGVVELSTKNVTGDVSSVEQSALLSVDSVLQILETASVPLGTEDTNTPKHVPPVVFRLVRFLAVTVESPLNARALGEAAMNIVVKLLLDTDRSETVLSGFLAKCIQAIASQSLVACELCGSETRNPVSAITAFLHTAYPAVDSLPAPRFVSLMSETEALSTQKTSNASSVEIEAKADATSRYKLEWVNELDESETFASHSLTEKCHAFDPFFFAAKVLEVLATAFARAAANPTDAAPAVDFADLLTQRLEASAKTPAIATKKKTAADLTAKPPNTGEAVVLCVLENVATVFHLLGAFASMNGDVAVSLLTTIRALVELPGGVRAMLSLAKTAMEATPDPVEGDEPTTLSPPANPLAWPWTREEACHSEHGWLLAPIIRVLEAPATCFFQLEAAVAVLTAILKSHSEISRTAPPPPTSAVISTVDVPITDTDRFINVALSHGVLVYLLAILDSERVPHCPRDIVRRQEAAHAIVGLALCLIKRGMLKQSEALAKRQELFDLHEQLTAAAAVAAAASSKTTKVEAGPTIDVASLQSQKLEFHATWASQLLDTAFDAHRFNYHRVPALLLATELGQDEIACALLAAGAAPDAASSLDGTTPLMLALLTKNNPLALALLEAGASVDAITQDGMDVTVWACALAAPVRDDIPHLISSVYSSQVTTTFVVPLDTLIELDSEESSPDVMLLETLLRKGLDVNVSNAHGDFVLHALLSHCVVRKRMRGVDVCFRYLSSRHIMGSAVLLKLVTDLVEHYKANVDACNHMGQTPLHLALLHGHVDAALFLLEKDANPNVRDVFGILPIHCACLGFFATSAQAIQVMEALVTATAKFELVQGFHTDCRKYKTKREKEAVEVEALLDRGFADVRAPPALTRTLATVDQVLSSISEPPDGFLPWHLACGACSHLNVSRLCLNDDQHTALLTNGAIRAAILEWLVQKYSVSLDSRTSRQLTGLHLAVKTDVDGSNAAVIDVLLASKAMQSILNAVHEPALIDSLVPIEEGGLVELTTEKLLHVPHAHVSARSSQHKYRVILPDGAHLEGLDRHQLKSTSSATSRYTLRLESAFSALHYALQVSDALSRRLLDMPDVVLQPEGSDLPLLALACAARRAPDIVARLVNPQVNMRVALPLHNGTSHEHTHSGDNRGSGGGGGTSARSSSRKQAAALHFAVMYEDLELVRALVGRKDHTNVNVRRSGDGFAPLHLACGMGDMAIIKLLLSAGANMIQMSTVSSSSSGVTPLHLLIKNDGMENEKLKELASDGFVTREMLLEGLGAPTVVVARAATKQDEQRAAADTGGTADASSGCGGLFHQDEDEMEISCVLLDEEEHNLSLFRHVQQRTAIPRGATGFTLRLQSELTKSDDVLSLFFRVISGGVATGSRRRKSNLSHVAEEADRDCADSPRAASDETSLMEAQQQFAQLKHWHECYAQKVLRSQWVEAKAPTDKILRRSSFDRRSTRELLALDDADANPKQ